MKKKLLCLLSAACLCISTIPVMGAGSKDTSLCTSAYEGSNAEAQSYLRAASPVTSYLCPCADGSIMRVQSAPSIKGLLAEYYDSAYHLKSSKLIPKELPIFGGFYETDTNYFVVTGQENPKEDDALEVFRITKYDKQWNKIKSAGLSACNTTIPFRSGSLRMDTCGKYLLIRTSHQMYADPDGRNHQANATIELDMENMSITDTFMDVMNSSVGYVSHSFNQFIKIEDNHIAAVDHGDAYPRSITLIKYAADASTGTFTPDPFLTPCAVTEVMSFPGATGNNYTGASIGGFEISDSAYLIAGNSVIQDEKNLERSTRNIFVAAVNKETSEVTTTWLTSYAEGDGTTRTPHLVKTKDGRYYMLWSRGGKVCYTEIDGNGHQKGALYVYNGNLSDCVPAEINGKLIWYVWHEQTMVFYDIDLGNPSQMNTTAFTRVPPSGSKSAKVNAGQTRRISGIDYRVTKSGTDNQAEVQAKRVVSKKKSIQIADTVKIAGVTCKVTSIAAGACEKNQTLTSVTIGKNVRTIGKNAFYRCKKLKKIDIKSKILKKVKAKAIQGIHKKAIIKAPKKQLKKYKKLFSKKAGFRKSMKIKK
ncbi:leucine-rich repeat protein [Lachnospiraceae bacterium 46-15]